MVWEVGEGEGGEGGDEEEATRLLHLPLHPQAPQLRRPRLLPPPAPPPQSPPRQPLLPRVHLNPGTGLLLLNDTWTTGGSRHGRRSGRGRRPGSRRGRGWSPGPAPTGRTPRLRSSGWAGGSGAASCGTLPRLQAPAVGERRWTGEFGGTRGEGLDGEALAGLVGVAGEDAHDGLRRLPAPATRRRDFNSPQPLPDQLTITHIGLITAGAH